MEYPKIAEYRDIEKAPRSNRKVLASRTHRGRTYELVRATAGYEPAGSMARWTEAYFSVTFDLDGASHGRRFRLEREAEARALFEQWTTREE